MGIVAPLFHDRPSALSLAVNLVLVFVVRFFGALYTSPAEKREQIRMQVETMKMLSKTEAVPIETDGKNMM